MNLKTLPLHERPREKMRLHGPEALTDSELLALILRTGTKKEDVLTMSAELLKKFNLKQLSRARLPVLEKQLGIGETKSTQIAACFEIARRLIKFKENRSTIHKAKDVADILMTEMRALSREHLKIILLNTRKKILHIDTLFIGSLNESIIHPREIFQRALEEGAAAIILVHNHPSGDPTPSDADIEATKQIMEAGAIIDIPLLDHVIIGDNIYFSMHEKNLI